MDMPECCGKEMSVKMESVKFLEMACGKCGDVVYVKKQTRQRPELLDD